VLKLEAGLQSYIRPVAQATKPAGPDGIRLTRMRLPLREFCMGTSAKSAALLVVTPNVRVKRATAAGRQGPGWDNVPRTPARALVACRWRAA
jgi:hypothetical protein